MLLEINGNIVRVSFLDNLIPSLTCCTKALIFSHHDGDIIRVSRPGSVSIKGVKGGPVSYRTNTVNKVLNGDDNIRHIRGHIGHNTSARRHTTASLIQITE